MWKETCRHVKRDQWTCQKRSVCGEKDLYILNEMWKEKRHVEVSKETCRHVKRDTWTCQKRCVCGEKDLYIFTEMWKETCRGVKRDVRVWWETYIDATRHVKETCVCVKETCVCAKRPVYMRHVCGKRPVCVERDLCVWKETCIYAARHVSFDCRHVKRNHVWE